MPNTSKNILELDWARCEAVELQDKVGNLSAMAEKNPWSTPG